MPPTSPLRRAVRPDWSTRNFDILLVARVAMSVGRALAGVVTPIYLALEGFSAVALAVYVLVVSLASALLSSAIGLGADRVGRRPFLVGTPLLAAAAGGVFAFTGSHPALFVMGAVGSFGRGAGAGAGAVGPYQPAEAALTTESVPTAHRNGAFGRLAFGSSAGALVGGLLALLVPTAHAHGAAAVVAFRLAFLAVAAASVVAGLAALWLVEDRPVRVRRPDEGRRPSRPRVRLPRRSRWLLYRLWATNAVNGAAIGMFGPFVTYWFFRRFGAGPGQVGVLFAVINAVTMASTLSAAGLARRWGLVRTLTAVRLAQAVLLVPMVLAPTFATAGAAYLVRMLVQRIGLPLRQSYVVGLADADERAAVAALANLPSQLAMAGSPLVTGELFQAVSLSLPFELSAGLQLANSGLFWAFFRHHPPDEERVRPATVVPVAGDGGGPGDPGGAGPPDVRPAAPG